ncbi:MAG: hypothetical protein ACAH80_11750 [Alphaproteobacteria bacterium]
MRRQKQPDDVEVPEGLARAAQRIGDLSERFFVLGELPGSKDFLERLADGLRDKGWPIGTTGADPLYNMVTDCFRWQRGKVSDISESLYRYLNEFSHTTSTRTFLTVPANIATLQETIEEAIVSNAKDWGDPFVVKQGQRSLVKAAFTAVSEKITGADTPARKLAAELKAMTAIMKKAYADHEVPSIEFQGRVEEYLDKKGWPIAEVTDIHRCLASRLWSLAREAQFKSTIPMRWELQYETFPPRTSFKEPTEYIMQNIPDIGEAAKAVGAELDAECKTERGLITRHCNIIGREEFTDFSWSEAKRNQKPTMPLTTEKNVKVKGPLQLKK